MSSIVYCAECGAPIERKGSDIRQNKTGRYYCDACTPVRNRQNGMMPQQRGWRRAAA